MASDDAARTVLYMRPDCKMWKCPDCAEANKAKWLSIIIGGMKDIQANNPDIAFRFVTLTCPRWTQTNAQGIHFFRQDWPKLQRRIKREYGQGYYVTMPELGVKYARYHQHLITTWPIKKRWLKDNCAACGLGYIADSDETANPGQVAFYATKYITKSLEVQDWPKTLHRVRTSQNWPRREIDAIAPEYQLSPVQPKRFDDMRYDLTRDGWKFVNLLTGQLLDAGENA